MSQPPDILVADSAGPILGLEQRTHLRYSCGVGSLMRLAVRPRFRGHRALLHDLSAGGLGILVGHPLEVGAVLAVELFRGPTDGGSNRLAEVVHVRPHPTPPGAPWAPRRSRISLFVGKLLGRCPDESPEGGTASWLVGCRFHQPLADDEVRHLLGRGR